MAECPVMTLAEVRLPWSEGAGNTGNTDVDQLAITGDRLEDPRATTGQQINFPLTWGTLPRATTGNTPAQRVARRAGRVGNTRGLYRGGPCCPRWTAGRVRPDRTASRARSNNSPGRQDHDQE